jgi:hypothetical protein
MKKQILIIVISFFIFSCGSRKVSKSNTEEKVKEKETELVKNDVVTTDNVKTETTTKTDEVTGEEIEETEVVPIDENKIAIYKGDTLKNAKLTKRKLKRNKALFSDSKQNTTSEAKQSDKSTKTTQKKQESQKESKIKEVEKEQFDLIGSILSYWWLFLIITLLIYLYRKYKNKFLIP